MCSLNEPSYDVLGKIVYADNHAVAYTGFERDIPWFLVLGYIPWVGLVPCFVACMMQTGVSRRSLYLLAAGSFVAHPLRGWNRAAVAFVASTVALPMVFAGASWPLYVGLHFDLPVWLDWILGLSMLALTAAVVVAAVTIAEKVRNSADSAPKVLSE